MTVCCVILMSEAKKNPNDILALYSTTFCSSAFPNAQVWDSAFATLCELQIRYSIMPHYKYWRTGNHYFLILRGQQHAQCARCFGGGCPG
jgi:hypothetical protein